MCVGFRMGGNVDVRLEFGCVMGGWKVLELSCCVSDLLAGLVGNRDRGIDIVIGPGRQCSLLEVVL